MMLRIRNDGHLGFQAMAIMVIQLHDILIVYVEKYQCTCMYQNEVSVFDCCRARFNDDIMMLRINNGGHLGFQAMEMVI